MSPEKINAGYEHEFCWSAEKFLKDTSINFAGSPLMKTIKNTFDIPAGLPTF
jgi:hypothetical protein